MRRGAHTRLKALFTIAASRDVFERVKSHVHSVVIDLGRGTFVESSRLSPFFFCSVFFFEWTTLLFYQMCFFFFISLLQLSINFFMAENHFLLLFLFLVFIIMFPVLFFSSPHVLSKGSDGRGQNTSSREMCASSGGMVTKVWKGGLLLACFWAWLKVWVDGLEINQGECVGWFFLGRQQWCVSCGWLPCVWHRQPAAHRCWRLAIISFLFSLSLSPLFCSLNVYSRRATWGGEAEPRVFNGLCRRSKEHRGKATQWRRSRQQRRAHEGPPWQAQAYAQQGLGKEAVQRY